jgi:hypothetical protein
MTRKSLLLFVSDKLEMQEDISNTLEVSEFIDQDVIEHTMISDEMTDREDWKVMYG